MTIPRTSAPSRELDPGQQPGEGIPDHHRDRGCRKRGDQRETQGVAHDVADEQFGQLATRGSAPPTRSKEREQGESEPTEDDEQSRRPADPAVVDPPPGSRRDEPEVGEDRLSLVGEHELDERRCPVRVGGTVEGNDRVLGHHVVLLGDIDPLDGTLG